MNTKTIATINPHCDNCGNEAVENWLMVTRFWYCSTCKKEVDETDWDKMLRENLNTWRKDNEDDGVF